MAKTVLNPASLAKPTGYSYAVKATGRTMLFVAGQVAFDRDGRVVGPGDVVKQFDQALANFKLVVEEAGGTMQDVVKLTILAVDKQGYRERLKEIGEAYRKHFGRHYPAMTFAEVKGLFDDRVLVEIEGVAVLDG